MENNEENFDIFNGRYELVTIGRKIKFKAENTTLFPTKMSSSNFIQLYTLYLLDKYNYMYGKQILNKLKSIVDEEVWKPSHGTLYPLLQSLEIDGYIEVAKIEKIDSEADKRIKKFYKITESGKQELTYRLDEFKKKIEGSNIFFKKIINEFYK